MQLFDPPGREIFTRDKKNVTVETFVCWRIGQSESKQSVVTFFRSLGSHEAAARGSKAGCGRSWRRESDSLN